MFTSVRYAGAVRVTLQILIGNVALVKGVVDVIFGDGSIADGAVESIEFHGELFTLASHFSSLRKACTISLMLAAFKTFLACSLPRVKPLTLTTFSPLSVFKL